MAASLRLLLLPLAVVLLGLLAESKWKGLRSKLGHSKDLSFGGAVQPDMA